MSDTGTLACVQGQFLTRSQHRQECLCHRAFLTVIDRNPEAVEKSFSCVALHAPLRVNYCQFALAIEGANLWTVASR